MKNKVSVRAIEQLNNDNDYRKVFSDLYTKYFERLCVYAYRFFSDKDDASEIVQDVMLKLWEKKETLHTIQSVENYLYRSVYNGCLRKLEHIKVHNKYVDHKRVRLLEIELENFEETFYQWEIREKLKQEIKNLSQQTKTVFEMRYIDQMKYKEIANKLDISERTVESHLQSAIKKLRHKLKKLL